MAKYEIEIKEKGMGCGPIVFWGIVFLFVIMIAAGSK